MNALAKAIAAVISDPLYLVTGTAVIAACVGAEMVLVPYLLFRRIVPASARKTLVISMFAISAVAMLWMTSLGVEMLLRYTDWQPAFIWAWDTAIETAILWLLFRKMLRSGALRETGD